MKRIGKLIWTFVCSVGNIFHEIARATIKPILLRRWARQLTNEKHHTTSEIIKESNPKNLCGIGGHGVRPFYRSWNDLYNDTHSTNPIDPTKYELKRKVKETLFFGYFGPLEAWCERQFTGDFALWSDEKGVYLMVFHDYDQTYFALKWGGTLPNFTAFDKEFFI